MADELKFIRDGLQRSQIDEFFADELGRAGYGGMEIAKTPMGTQIVLKAEKPGMVIGKGGENIRKVTAELESRFDLDDPQIDVQEVEDPDLNARIVADRLANALERGWYFRKAGHTTLERIMSAGALGAQIVMAGTVTGSRSRVEKFTDGYIKHNGEPAEELVDMGQGVAVMKLGTIGVTVKIIPPDAELPDDFRIHEDAETDDLIPEGATVEVEPDDTPVAEAEEPAETSEPAAPETDEVVEAAEEEIVEPAPDEEPTAPAADDGEDADEDIEAKAARLVEELDAAMEDDE